ncbi:hypothetical protein D3C71_1451490 [compost metagenome]
MRRSAQAGIAQVDLALVLLNPGGELLEVVRGHGGPSDQRHGHIVDHAQVFKVVGHAERQLAVQRGHGGHANVVEQQRVAVRCGAGYAGCTDGAAGTGRVVHHHSSTQGLAQCFGQVARHAVGGAARSKGNHDGDGLVLGGIVLGAGAKSGGCGRSDQCKFQRCFHGSLL